MTLDARTWSRVTAAFERVADLQPEQRTAALETFHLEPEVQAWLDRLLQAHDQDDESLIDRTVLGVVHSLHEEVTDTLARDRAFVETHRDLPERIGPWRTVGEIACGGMGVVLRAERDDGQFEQQVAIKLLRARALDAAEQRLLQQEVRLLARLEHPGIARLIDGGVAADGQPFLVMEYVDGEPIDQWCRRTGASLEQRVALVDQVCAALAHAHQRLVVHADVKPANVLVDEQGRIRLVDFGIAAVLQSEPETSRQGALRCSPAWCAPEQLAGVAPTPAQDIFATGALLRRLLTGQRVRNGAAVTCWLAGRERTPDPLPPPSDQLLPGLRRARVRGDLDAVCLRALSERPEGRYSTIESLGDDLRRWRQRRTVAARPLSSAGRAARFVTRHPVPVAASLVAVLALVVGFTIATINAKQARHAAATAELEARRADSVRDFVLDLFRAADPLRQGGAELSTRQVLAGAANTLDGNPDLPEATRLEVLHLLSDVQRSLGWYEDADILLNQADELLATSSDVPPHLVAETRFQQALLASSRSERDRAIEHLREAVSTLQGLPDRRALELLARAQIELGLNLDRNGETEASRLRFEDAGRILDGLDPPEPDIEKLLHGNLGIAAYRAGDYERALREMEKTLALQKSLGNAEQGAVVTTLSNLAAIHAQLGQLDLALARDREALAIARQAFPAGHTMIGRRLYALGDTLRQTGDFEASLNALNEAREIQVQADLPAQVELVDLTRVRTLLGLGAFEPAANLARTVGQAMEAREGPLSGVTLLLLDRELAALHALDDPALDQVLELARARVRQLEDSEGTDRRVQRLRWRLAEIALDRGRAADADEWLQMNEPAEILLERQPPIIALSLELRRRTQTAANDLPGLRQRLLELVESRSLEPDTRAYAWSALAESARASGDEALLSRALEALDSLAQAPRLDGLSRRLVERTRARFGPPASAIDSR